MKYLYKYPHAPYPYQWLINENRNRHGQGFEFELLDTGIFDENRYFDVFVEYAKASPEDLCIRIEAVNRGPEAAPFHIIPQLWFPNIWAWSNTPGKPPVITDGPSAEGAISLLADDANADASTICPSTMNSANATSTHMLMDKPFLPTTRRTPSASTAFTAPTAISRTASTAPS